MHFSLRRRPTLRAARLGATVTLIALTLTSLTNAARPQSNSLPVALRDAGLRLGERIPARPDSGVVHYSAPPRSLKPSARVTAGLPAPAPPAAATAAPAPPAPAAPRPPTRQVLGFAPYWTLDTWREWRLQDLSAIAFFAVTVDGDGNTVADESWPSWQGQELTDMVDTAHRAGVKVLVTVKCFDDDQLNSILTDADNLRRAERTATDLARMRNLDGVVVDFEGLNDHPGMRQGMSEYVAGLRAGLNAWKPGTQVVVATYTSSAKYGDGLFDIRAMTPSVDAFFVMAYDMQGDNTPGHASSTAPLQAGQFNDTDTVSQYLSVTSPDKVILGVPYYGYKWSVNSPDRNAEVSGDPEPTTYSQMLSDFACAQSLGWHDGGSMPWATWYSPAAGDPCGANLGTWRELYFDSATTIGQKYDLVNRSNLRGTGMWALGFDSGHAELWDTLESHVTAAH